MGVTVQAMSGRARLFRVSRARSAVFGLARRFTDMSLEEIACRLGRRDHSTVIYGVKRFEREVKSGDPVSLAVLKATQAALGGKPPGVRYQVVDTDPEGADPASFPGFRVTYRRPDGSVWVAVLPMRRL